MKIPLVDLKTQYQAIKPEIDAAIARVIDSTQFILGPEVKEFEEEVATYVGTKYAIGVASGTDALYLGLIACGIGLGDEVITTPYTFFATAEVVTNCGATPVFVDIEMDTFNIDPRKIEAKITRKTKAILPVHLFGQPANIEPILEIAAKYNLKVIEDCAQAFGAVYKGKKVGSIGDAGCFSFFPSKALGAYGDGGMVTTNNPAIEDKVRILRNHGAKVSYHHLVPGFNSRLDAMQAAILRVKFKHIDDWNCKRAGIAAMYAQKLAKYRGVICPQNKPYGIHSFNYYTLRLSKGINRDELQKYLEAAGISSMVYYPLSLHLQDAYHSLGYKRGDFPVSECSENEVLSLPMFPELNEQQIDYITEKLAEFLKK
jgi:dTDP-4-amino-4,6-dideoxygalactose transaminase